MTLLRANSELRKDRVSNWTLPAWVVQVSDGSFVNVCPSAGACVKLCYARNGTYQFKNVKQAHVRNLELVLNDLPEFIRLMDEELSGKKFRPNGVPRLTNLRDQLIRDEWVLSWLDSGGSAVRIHDSGDFFNDAYTLAWLTIAEKFPDVLFYAYTKEVSRFRRIVEGKAPANFRWIYSLGGKEDYLLSKDTDRHADVFPNLEAIENSGYVDQEENDLLCVLLDSTRIGVPANNIKHYQKRQGSETFGSLQESRKKKTT